jgi:molybdate transport system permease protein
MLSADDIDTLVLTIKLASLSTAILLVIGTPLAWWLTQSQSRVRHLANALVALPLVLPPSVLGFYLLLLLGPQGWIGHITQQLGLGTLPFTFAGLVVASVLYSLPFVVQPLQTAFAAIPLSLLEAAATLRAGPIDRFFSIALPLSKRGFLNAGVLGFAHTLGEFGVVLMVGGNIPNQTRVISLQIYNHVEALEYPQAHQLALLLLIFSFLVLLLIYSRQSPSNQSVIR